MKKTRTMRCDNCGSKNIETTKNVGWDVYDDCEEHQHEDKCKECGATRLWADVFSCSRTETNIWCGRWTRP